MRRSRIICIKAHQGEDHRKQPRPSGEVADGGVDPADISVQAPEHVRLVLKKK